MGKKRFSLKYLDNMPYVKDNLNGNEYYLYWAVEWMNELYEENEVLKEENKQLQYESQQTKEYLQTKINECKDYKKMKEIVFGVEQAVGYEKALLQFQKGLKSRLKDE